MKELITALKNYGFNTQPRGGGCMQKLRMKQMQKQFQHTAARRRLLSKAVAISGASAVSTHSRAEAAAKKPS